MKIHNSNTVAAPGGPYRHGIETPPNARWLHIAGQIGVAPEDFDGQADQCWRNIKAILAAAGMGVENLVKVTHFLTRAEDIAAYGRVRSRHLGEARPASTLLVISALARPGLLVEVEAIAAKA
ncbi:MAG TPA: RidA family protein [Stellaceae bacterium]|jgi:2-iminobutanoate/2-iminopropanoate deaminase|nr:RidA family protein [Stellaceae bacterium]